MPADIDFGVARIARSRVQEIFFSNPRIKRLAEIEIVNKKDSSDSWHGLVHNEVTPNSPIARAVVDHSSTVFFLKRSKIKKSAATPQEVIEANVTVTNTTGQPLHGTIVIIIDPVLPLI